MDALHSRRDPAEGSNTLTPPPTLRRLHNPPSPPRIRSWNFARSRNTRQLAMVRCVVFSLIAGKLGPVDLVRLLVHGRLELRACQLLVWGLLVDVVGVRQERQPANRIEVLPYPCADAGPLALAKGEPSSARSAS